jgi:hypothetical protein
MQSADIFLAVADGDGDDAATGGLRKVLNKAEHQEVGRWAMSWQSRCALELNRVETN